MKASEGFINVSFFQCCSQLKQKSKLFASFPIESLQLYRGTVSKLHDYCFSQRNCSLLRCDIKGRACCAENRLKQAKLLDVPLWFVLFSCIIVILAVISSWQERNTTYKYFGHKS